VRSGWLVGAVAVVVLAYISYNTLRTDAVSQRGPAAGAPLPPFAAPLSSSDADADANIATHANSGAEGARDPAVHGCSCESRLQAWMRSTSVVR